jgi:hypothetical protein
MPLILLKQTGAHSALCVGLNFPFLILNLRKLVQKGGER